MKKILFVVTQSELGGAQRYILEIASRLNKEEYQVKVAAGRQGGGHLFDELDKIGIRSFALHHMERVPSLPQIFLSIRELTALFRAEKPDVVFLCSTTAGLLGSAAVFFLRNRSFKIIYRIGGWSFLDPRPPFQKKALIWLEKITAPLKDIIIVNSERDRETSLKYKICPAERIAVVYNGIDAANLNFLPRQQAREFLSQKLPQLKITENTLLAGCIANFYKTKGLSYLVRAFRLLDAETKAENLKLVIIGQGPEKNEILSLIAESCLQDKIFLAEHIPDAYRLLCAFDFYVLPSLKEGFPWVILEAASSQIPVIATKVGALPEIMENKKHGLLVEPGDISSLAGALSWMASNKKEARIMASHLYNNITENFSSGRMIRATEKIISRLTSG